MSNESLKKVLRQSPLVVVKSDDKTKFKSSKSGKDVQNELLIPPSKAMINFAQQSGKFKTVKKTFKAGKDQDLPEFWTNYTPVPNQDSKKFLISTRPQNQQKCGSCFAFACAGAINDGFIFDKNLSFNPDVSPMSILSCVKDEGNAKCEGGDPLSVLNYIARNGVTTNNCMNYTLLCNQSPACYAKVKKAFDEIATEESMKIPECGCCNNSNCKDTEKFSYYITEPILIAINDTGYYEGVTDGINVIKYHILRYGSAVTGYVVYGNFVNDKTNGRFEKTRGIYIEGENYGDDNDTNKFFGCHAVCIVGWGIEKEPITVKNGITLKVGDSYQVKDSSGKYYQKIYQGMPYWIARNSWDSLWGNNGYFKMAMHQEISDQIEINKTCAFERINMVTIMNQTYQMGGVLLFKPKTFERYQKISTDCGSDNSIYCSEKNPNGTTQSQPSQTNQPNQPIQENVGSNNLGLVQNNSISKSFDYDIHPIEIGGLVLVAFMYVKKYDSKLIYLLIVTILLLRLSGFLNN